MNNLPLVNIYNKKREITLFLRDEQGNLKTRKDNSFYPYYYEPSPDGKFLGYDGTKLKKIVVNEPSEVGKFRSNESFESDILYPKRYIIDKIDKFDKTFIKWTMIDTEVQKPENEYLDPLTAKFPVTSISLYNSKYNKFRNWFIKDFGTNLKKAEIDLFVEFITYLKKAKFDLILGWYLCDFDYPYLYSRFAQLPQKYFFDKESMYNNFAVAISPIGQIRSGHKDFNNFYPAGTSVVDYLVWLKKIYDEEKSYGLDAIMEKYLGRGKKYKDIDFSQITSEIKERNLDDCMGMVELEQKHFQLIPLFDEMRRFAKVLWEDFGFHSRLIDSLILQEAREKKVMLPKGKSFEEIKEKLEGAYRETFETGAWWNSLSKYDISSTYPSMIINFCLDPSNLREKEGKNTLLLPITDRVTNEIKEMNYFEQNANAILPSVAQKLIVKKDEMKKQLKQLDPETKEGKDSQLKYDGLKEVVNSVWGTVGLRSFRLYSSKVAGTITSLARSLLHYLRKETEENGYKVVYCDTDGLIVMDNGKNISEFLNKLVKQWSKEKFNKENSITIDYEGKFEKILILTMCRYVGWLRTPKGIKKEIKGVEIKRKDSTVFMAKFQDELIDKILNQYERESIVQWIKGKMFEITQRPIEEISFPAKLERKPEDYKTEVTNKHGTTYKKKPPIFVRALLNSPLNKRVGDPYFWIYVKSDDPNKNVMAFDEKNKSHIKEIDWEMMIQRNILNKVEVIFEAMKWDLGDLVPKKPEKIGGRKSSDRRLVSKTKSEGLSPSSLANKDKTHKELAEQFRKELGMKEESSPNSAQHLQKMSITPYYSE